MNTFFSKTPLKPSNTSTQKHALGPIQRKTRLILQVSGLVVILVLLLNIAILFFSMSKLKVYKNTQLQISTTRHNTQDLQDVVDFLTLEKNKIDLINTVLPAEKDIIKFIQTVEVLANTHSQSTTLEFSGKFTSGPTIDAHIPFTIKISTDWANLQEFLTKLEKLAYLIEITSIEATVNENEGNQIWSATINAKVYVQDPFK